MTFFFGDSFDLYSSPTLADCLGYWGGSFGSSACFGLSTVGRFSGGRSLVTTSSGAVTPYISKSSNQNDPVHHFTVAFQQTGALSGTSLGFYITLMDGSTQQCSIVFRFDGIVLLISGSPSGTVLATYVGAVASLNVWYSFEFEVVINNTTGSFKVRKNGNTVDDFSATGLNTRGGTTNNYANAAGIGVYNFPSQTQYIDDFLWRSDPASVPWLGDLRCYTRMPVSDATVQWTRGGALTYTPFIQTTSVSVVASQSRYMRFTQQVTGTVPSVAISLLGASTANVKAAIYDATGSAGAPGAVLATSNVVAAPQVGNNVFTFASPPTLTAGTNYFLGINADTSSGSYGYSSTNLTTNYFKSETYSSWPTNNPTGLTSNVASIIFTVSTTPSAPTNSMFVGEAQQDAGVSYVSSSTVGQSDLYNISSITSPPGVLSPPSVVGVVTRAYMQKSDAGNRSAAVQIQSGPTNAQGTPLGLPTGAWTWSYRTDLTDPNTGVAWAPSAVNSAQIGAVVTA